MDHWSRFKQQQNFGQIKIEDRIQIDDDDERQIIINIDTKFIQKKYISNILIDRLTMTMTHNTFTFDPPVCFVRCTLSDKKKFQDQAFFSKEEAIGTKIRVKYFFNCKRVIVVFSSFSLDTLLLYRLTHADRRPLTYR